MPAKSKPLDANLLIRFFTNDNPSKANAVESLLKKASKDELELPDVIIAEIVWVLQSFYKLEKREIVEKLESLLSLENLKINRSLLKTTIDLFRRYNISYIDAYLAAYSMVRGKSNVLYSFDKGLDKIAEITRREPK